MNSFRPLLLVASLLLSCFGCAPQPESTSQSTEAPSTVATVPAERAVQICLSKTGLLDVVDPRLTRVKDNGRQEVAWKSHGTAYLVAFETKNWPFHATATDSVSAGDGFLYTIPVPAGGTSGWFKLKKNPPGVPEREYPYNFHPRPAVEKSDGSQQGPAVIGEG